MKSHIYYIYAIENNEHKVKIGRTTNFPKRLYSLSGSNTGGNLIINYYVSPPTYVYTLERAFHDHFNKYRIKGTEWFEGVSFEEVKQEMEKCFNSENYKKANRFRMDKWHEENFKKYYDMETNT